jgi:hypothetical protein
MAGTDPGRLGATPAEPDGAKAPARAVTELIKKKETAEITL